MIWWDLDLESPDLSNITRTRKQIFKNFQNGKSDLEIGALITYNLLVLLG